MNCHKCGAELSDGNCYCTVCGTEVTTERKKRKFPTILLIIWLAVLLAIGVIAFMPAFSDSEHYYEVVHGSFSWQEAQNYAQKMGGYLVQFDDEKELDLVISMMTESDKEHNYWIGAKRSLDSKSYEWYDESHSCDPAALNDPSSCCTGYWLEDEPTFEWKGIQEYCVQLYFDANTNAWVLNDVAARSDSSSYGMIIEYERQEGDRIERPCDEALWEADPFPIYLEILQRHMDEVGYDADISTKEERSCRGCLYDIDCDGVSEMILTTPDSLYPSVEVWTVREGKAVMIGIDCYPESYDRNAVFAMDPSFGTGLVYATDILNEDYSNPNYYVYMMKGTSLFHQEDAYCSIPIETIETEEYEEPIYVLHNEVVSKAEFEEGLGIDFSSPPILTIGSFQGNSAGLSYGELKQLLAG